MSPIRIIILLVTTLILTISIALFVYSYEQPKYLIKNGSRSIEISLVKYKEAGSSIISSEDIGTKENIISEWKLNYPVYHFECADINGDGSDDILVGVIKPSRFDSVSRKRIFIFKLFDGYIRPLWLGSRVSQPLEDFKVIRSQPLNLIRTIEYEENGNFLVAEYKWKGFGLTFVKYIIRNSKLEEVRKIFNQTNTDNENN